MQISFPAEAKAKYAEGFDMALANFGAPLYGGALMYVEICFISFCGISSNFFIVPPLVNKITILNYLVNVAGAD